MLGLLLLYEYVLSLDPLQARTTPGFARKLAHSTLLLVRAKSSASALSGAT